MLLCIDVGNTNIKYAVFKGDKLVTSYRVSSRHTRTADEYGATLINLLNSSSIFLHLLLSLVLLEALHSP